MPGTGDDQAAPGGRPTKATAERYLDALDAIDGPAFTYEIADQLDVSTRTARRRLTNLADTGVIATKKPRKTAIWWAPDDARDRLAALDTIPFGNEPADYNS